jgi:hypothetical protein
LKKVINVLAFNQNIIDKEYKYKMDTSNERSPSKTNILKYNILNQKKKSKKLIVPYRESLITKLFKKSIEGDNYMIMIANISPNEKHFEENICTLEWASKASKIALNKTNKDND